VRMFWAYEGIATGVPAFAISRWGLSAGATELTDATDGTAAVAGGRPILPAAASARSGEPSWR